MIDSAKSQMVLVRRFSDDGVTSDDILKYLGFFPGCSGVELEGSAQHALFDTGGVESYALVRILSGHGSDDLLLVVEHDGYAPGKDTDLKMAGQISAQLEDLVDLANNIAMTDLEAGPARTSEGGQVTGAFIPGIATQFE